MPARSAIAALALTLLALAGCESLTGPRPGGGPDVELPRALTADEQALIGAGNRFAFDLIRQVPLDDPAEPNVFLSPLSASMALGMAMNGAAGATWSQMRDALGFAGLEEPAINRSYHDLIELLRDLDPKVEFGLGNSVWARAGTPFHEDFLDRVRTWFEAHAETLDFDDPAAVEAMNAWVDALTRGRIPELVDEIPGDAIMYLINAVYFNGDWRYEFDEAETRPRPFTRADGSTVEADMMGMQADLRLYRDADVSVVELPYGGGAFSAIAAVPHGDRTIADLVAELDAGTWADWMARIDAADPAAVSVLLPKLELRYDRVLNDDLQALGMRDAFNAGDAPADFSRLTPLGLPGKVYISRVQQKSFLKVDEKGTEAAAATFVEVGIVCAGCGTPSVRFDRPFIFAIRERLTGSVLFIGVIGDPTA